MLHDMCKNTCYINLYIYIYIYIWEFPNTRVVSGLIERVTPIKKLYKTRITGTGDALSKNDAKILKAWLPIQGTCLFEKYV